MRSTSIWPLSKALARSASNRRLLARKMKRKRRFVKASERPRRWQTTSDSLESHRLSSGELGDLRHRRTFTDARRTHWAASSLAPREARPAAPATEPLRESGSGQRRRRRPCRTGAKCAQRFAGRFGDYARWVEGGQRQSG
eukprot:9332491-Prorocentrum_lima.AAC.1